MSDLTNAMQLVFDKVGALVHQYGPEVSSLVLNSVRVDAMSQIINGVMCGALAAGTAFAMRKVFAWMNADDVYDRDVLGVIMLLVGGCAFLTLGTLAVTELCDFWNWTALFNPALWLAHVAVLRLGT